MDFPMYCSFKFKDILINKDWEKKKLFIIFVRIIAYI